MDTDHIIVAGFDGAFLNVMDAWQYFKESGMKWLYLIDAVNSHRKAGEEFSLKKSFFVL